MTLDPKLLDLWLKADRLQVSTIRALIEELDYRRRGESGQFQFATPSHELEHPRLVLDQR